MADISLLIIGAVSALGYTLKKTRDNYENIYTSNNIKRVNDIIKGKAEKKMKDAQNPTFSGVGGLPYITGQIGMESFGNSLDFNGQKDYNYTRINDPRYTQQKYDKATFNDPVSAYSDNSQHYSVSDLYNQSNVSKMTGETIQDIPKDKRFTRKDIHEVRERYTPFLPSRHHTSKKEVERFSDGIQVNNVHTGMELITEDITDRYIPSRMREGERPFEQKQIQKPKAWSIDEVGHAKDTFKTIDDLVVNPKQSYKGRILEGKMHSQNTRGILPDVQTYKPPTTSDKNFIIPGSANFKAAQSEQDLATNFQKTNREMYTQDYTGIGRANVDGEYHGIQNYTESKKKEGAIDFIRNMKALGKTGDYTRDSMTAVDTERQNTSNIPISHGHRQSLNVKVDISDAKQTLREGLGNQGITNARGQFQKGNGDAIAEGVSEVNAKTTMKETNAFSYSGNAKGADAMSYLASNYNVKTTLRELMSSDRRASGVNSMFNNSRLGFSSKPNKKVIQNKRQALNNHVSVINSFDKIGKTTILQNKTVLNDRNDPSLVHDQLKSNPYDINTAKFL
jgi:hypothetical protein